jgi:hypothetical protein
MHGPGRAHPALHSYALDELEAARACFDALAAEPAAPHAHVENAATRQADRVSQAWAVRDWERLTELYPAGCWLSDRKRMTQLGELDRTRQLELIRPIFDMSSSRLVQVFLATRGDRLTLARQRFEIADRDVGPSEIESLVIIEVDEHGNRVALVRFDADAFDAAYSELDTRYAAGEAAPHARVTAGMREFMRAFTERDWDALAARCAPDIIVHDRRLLGWETLHGPAAYVEALRALVELAPDTRLRIDHTTICAHGYLVITVWEGTREGGAYEAPSLMVAELDGQGRIRRFDQYDLERLDQARARYEELRPDLLRIPPNAATRPGSLAGGSRQRTGMLSGLCAPIVFRSPSPNSPPALATFVANSHDRTRGTRFARCSPPGRSVDARARPVEVDGGAFEVETLRSRKSTPRPMSCASFDPETAAPPAGAARSDPHSDAIKRASDTISTGSALPAGDFVMNDHRRTGLGELGKDTSSPHWPHYSV